MRKMTKKAVTFAAMSAMTAASASMAFAAEKQETNISSIAKQEEAVNSAAVGEWSGDDVKGWKFTKEDGTKLKDQWAQIDGVWYYFKGETIAQDRFLTLDDKGYFFDKNGRLATGWQKINSGMDAYSDIDIPERLVDSYSNYYVHADDNREYDYHDYVWCYFDNSGIAKHNEWFQDSTGLWYYFDNDVMVKNIYNYEVVPDNNDAANSRESRFYGFDEEGAMLIGWNYKELKTTWNNPTADAKGRIWYYYNSNGQMQKAGWKQIDGKWYLFADREADWRKYNSGDMDGVGSRDDKWSMGGFPLIVNSYVASYNNKKYEYFYVDKDGKMVTGVQEVPKEAYKVLFYTDPSYSGKNLNVAYDLVQTTGAVTVNFGSNGAAKDGIVNNRYYVMDTLNTRAVSFDTTKSQYIDKINNSMYDATDFFGKVGNQIIAPSTEWTFSQGNDVIVNNAITIPTISKADFEKSGTPLKYEWEQLAELGALTGSVKSGTEYYLQKTTVNDRLIAEANAAYNKAVEAYNAVVTAGGNYNSAVSEGVTYINGAVTGYNKVYDADVLWILEQAIAPTSNMVARMSRMNGTVNVDSEIKDLQTTIASLGKELETVKQHMSAGADKNARIDALNKSIQDAKDALGRLGLVKAYVEDQVEAQKNQGEYNSLVSTYNTKKKAFENAQRKVFDAGLYSFDAKNNVYVLEHVLVDNGISTEERELTNNFIVRGELVKNAFVAQNDYTYLADKNGDLVTNKAVLICDDIVLTSASQSGTTYKNAYILFGGDGKGVYNYDGTRKSISIGGVTYWATDETIQIGGKAKALTVFVSNKQVNGQY